MFRGVRTIRFGKGGESVVCSIGRQHLLAFLSRLSDVSAFSYYSPLLN